MSASVLSISNFGLMLAFIPAAIVIGIMFRWKANPNSAMYATVRMFIQLMAIGYVLIYIFESDNYWVILAVLTVMLTAASWIAIRPIKPKKPATYRNALISITVGGVPILVLVSQGVINVEPWFSPRYLVPLAGMIFAGSMNAVSLAAERFQSECSRGLTYEDARRVALQAALIPTINSLFAVGLVSLPGMMTGQILSGVSPLVAAKYQMVVMTMLFGATGISAATYLMLNKTPSHIISNRL